MGGADARRAAGPARPGERVRGTGPPTSPALDRFGNGPVQGHAQEKRRFPPDPPSHGRNTRQLNESGTPLAGTSVDGSEQAVRLLGLQGPAFRNALQERFGDLAEQ